MSEHAIKTFEQEAWSARAASWLDSAARATALAAPHLISALGVEAGAVVLDLCCGPGVVAGAAHAMGAETLGVDYAHAMVAEARKRLPQGDFRIGDAEALDVRKDEYDAVACNFALQHLAHPEQAMREALRALKPGGRFAWTHWLAPGENPVARAYADALERHGDPELIEDALDSRAWRLAEAGAATTSMRRAGFRDVETRILPIEIETPRDRLAETAWAMLSRAPLAYDRQSDEARSAIDDALTQALGGDAAELRTVSLRAPALLCMGVKPREAVKQQRRFGIVRRLLEDTPKTGDA